MEEVPAHVHPGPIVTDVLSKQHEHKSGLIWSGDRETCYTDLQCRRFGRNLFQCYSTAPRRLVEIIDRIGLGGVFRLLGVRLSLSHFFGYKVKKEPLEAWILRAFTGSETDDDLILRTHGFIFLLIGGHMVSDFSGNLVHAAVHGGFGRCKRSLSVSSDLGVVAYTYIAVSADDGDSGQPSCSSWRNMFARVQMVPDAVDTRLDLHRIQLRGNDNKSWVTQHAIHLDAWNQWRLRVRDGPVVAVAALSYPSDEYIRWYRGITWVYIGNPANHDTRAHGYHPVGVDRRMMTSMLQEVDDMVSVAIREPSLSPSQMAVVMKKVKTIIRRCMVSIGGTLGCTPSQHDIQATFPV
ncbi:hypothetical protein M9H77_32420 [Catharanthus roseus]|uniref:Uncharacterized protein n=1 Tax=Catharanthus roseus TaxID=4058 RepID=A0ACC0A5C9_CATRO|nr:hypothetical protein M9H77_32420 [Catharanthus roseus]